MADKGRFKGAYKSNKYIVTVQLQTYFWEEDGIYYAYSPAFDLTGYGKSETEAKESFEITLSETIKYMERKNTTFDELERLGWTVNRKKKRIRAPELQELQEDNKDFAELISRPGVRAEQEDMELSLA